MARLNYESASYKSEAIKAAEELYYGKAVIKKLEEAKSDGEIERIMIDARHRKFKMNPGEDEIF